jgi:flagellar hook-associated protein 3 FlgL
MSLRVNPNLWGTIINGLETLTQNQDQALAQLASGQKLNSPSDDPAAVATLVGVRMQESSDSQYLQNISSLNASLQVADSTLSSVVESLTSAESLGIEGANGGLTTANRQAIAQEVQGIQQQMLSLANTSYNGQYLFSGTATTTRPYVADSTSTSGVSYKGNDTRSSVEISDGETMPVNLPGSQLFSSSGNNVFQALQDLYNALQNNGDVASATTEVQNALSYVTTQRAFYGNSLQRLNTAQTFLTQENLQLSERENDLLSADMAKTISDVVQTETAQQALMEAAGKIPHSSLFDYLSQ